VPGLRTAGFLKKVLPIVLGAEVIEGDYLFNSVASCCELAVSSGVVEPIRATRETCRLIPAGTDGARAETDAGYCAARVTLQC